MVMRFVLGLVALLTIPQAAPFTAQAPKTMATTPSGCSQEVKDYVALRTKEVQLALPAPQAGADMAEMLKQSAARSAAMQPVNDARVVMLKECAAKFDVKTVADKELAPLAQLYFDAGQPDLARAAVDRALAAKGQSPADRAATLSSAVTTILREPKGDERNARLEIIVAQLDALPAASIDQRILAHNAMLGYYRYDDLDGGIITHATWLINAAKAFDATQRMKYGTNVVFANVDMAEAWAGQGMNDKALDLLKRAKVDWAATPHANDYIDPEIARLELVGTPGAPLTAPRWLNMPDGKTDLDVKGSVTLLEFSAHWCVPCKESYPGINRLRAKYGSQGFRVVVATQLWGYFQAERPLEPGVEIDRDRTYFAEHGLDVPIAIGDKTPAPTRKADGSYEYKKDPNDDHYRVGGIPQIQLIDKHGVIRLMMVGYDDANEGKLAKMIEGLLKEK